MAHRLHDAAAPTCALPCLPCSLCWCRVRVDDQDAAQATASDSIALLVGKDAPLCSGSLVAARVVLTAASCVSGGDKGRPEVVLVGAVNAYLDPFRWGMCCAVRPAGTGAGCAAGQALRCQSGGGSAPLRRTSPSPPLACSALHRHALQAARGVRCAAGAAGGGAPRLHLQGSAAEQPCPRRPGQGQQQAPRQPASRWAGGWAQPAGPGR